MKTILEWFNEVLPEPYRSWAIENCKNCAWSELSIKREHSWAAIIDGFSWGHGKGSAQLWDKIYYELINGKEIKWHEPTLKGFGVKDRRFIEFSQKS